MKLQPHIKILILNWNGEAIIKRCLDSIKSLQYDNYSVDVIDNGSTDDSINIIKVGFPNIVIHEIKENLGYAKGYNYAFDILKNEEFIYYLILNNDVIVNKYFLSKLIYNLDKYGKQNIYGSKIYYLNSKKIWYAGGYYNTFLGFARHRGINKYESNYSYKTHKTGYVSGCCMLISKSLIEELNGFDERYVMYYEDVDLCYRASKLSYDIYVMNNCYINHEVSYSLGNYSLNKLYKKICSQIKFIYKINNIFLFILSLTINIFCIPIYLISILYNKVINR